VAPVLELAPLDLVRHHRQPRRDALQGLNAGHLVLMAALRGQSRGYAGRIEISKFNGVLAMD
jgi:hypothetical protein